MQSLIYLCIYLASFFFRKNTFIESYNSSVIRYLAIDTVESNDSWRVIIDTYFANNKKGLVEGNLIVEIDLDFINITKIFPISLKPNNYSEMVSIQEIVFPKVLST